MTNKLGRKPHDPDYGLGSHTIDGDRLGLIDERELTERLIRAFQVPSYHPPRLPAVATELLALSQKPDVEFSAIESLLERDAMLAGEIVSVARSVFYSRIGRVSSLRDALVRVGLVKLREVVLQAAMNLRVFRSASYGSYMERLREHSRGTAHLSRIVSHYTPMAEEQAFMCGLLHDVGIAGILLVLGDVERGKQPPDLAVLWPAIDAAHGPAGARMVELWGLPEEISMVVGAHHQVRIDGFDHPMAATVCLAETLAAEIDMAFLPTSEAQAASEDLDPAGLLAHGHIDRTDDFVVARAREALGLSESTIELIRADAREWAASEERSA